MSKTDIVLNFLHLVRKPWSFFRTVVVVVAVINSSRQDGNLVSCIVGVNLLLLLFSLQCSSQAEERRDKAGRSACWALRGWMNSPLLL